MNGIPTGMGGEEGEKTTIGNSSKKFCYYEEQKKVEVVREDVDFWYCFISLKFLRWTFFGSPY